MHADTLGLLSPIQMQNMHRPITPGGGLGGMMGHLQGMHRPIPPGAGMGGMMNHLPGGMGNMMGQLPSMGQAQAMAGNMQAMGQQAMGQFQGLGQSLGLGGAGERARALEHGRGWFRSSWTSRQDDRNGAQSKRRTPWC